MKTKSLLSNVLCVLVLFTGYALSGCTEGPIDDGGNEQEEIKDIDMGSAIFRIEKRTASTATFTGNLKAPASEAHVTVYYTADDALDFNKAKSVSTSSFGSDQDFEIVLVNLRLDTKYKYCVLTDVASEKKYSEVGEFSTAEMKGEVSVTSVTATTASFSVKIEGLSEMDLYPVFVEGLDPSEEISIVSVGVQYSTVESEVREGKGTRLYGGDVSPDGTFTLIAEGLDFGTKYYVSTFAEQYQREAYGKVTGFSTDKVTCAVEVSAVTGSTVTFTGKVSGMSDEDWSSLSFGIVYTTDKDMLSQGKGKNLIVSEIASDGSFSVQATGLDLETKYYFNSYVSDGEYGHYSSPQEFTTLSPYNNNLDVSSASDLGSTANCYIVSKAGLYKFRTVKGNSTESVGNVASAFVLWESFGTDVAPDFADLISGVSYKDGYIAFQTASIFREGNAVIAAKDADGTILWSWHIWMTDEPQEQVYANDAGVLMDRNLGATSVTPGDICTYGLLYQWGRKDPFLNASTLNDRMKEAKSTITWPDILESDSSIGTIAYATSHPTTFIDDCFNNRDWYYSSTTGTDNTRWQKSKTIYDPCPAGWRVPNGAKTGVWCTALKTTQDWTASSGYDAENRGIDFSLTSKVLGSSGPIWYPFAGLRTETHGILWDTGNVGFYWSVNTHEKYAYSMTISGYTKGVEPWSLDHRAYGMSVRCMKE